MAKIEAPKPVGKNVTDTYSLPRSMAPHPIISTPPVARQESLGSGLAKFSELIGISGPKLLQTEFSKIDEDIASEWGSKTLDEQRATFEKYESDLVKSGKIPSGTEIYRRKRQKEFLANTVLDQVIIPKLNDLIEKKSHPEGISPDNFSALAAQLFNAQFPEGGLLRDSAAERWGSIITSARHKFLEAKRVRTIHQSRENLGYTTRDLVKKLLDPDQPDDPTPDQELRNENLKRTGTGVSYPTNHPYASSSVDGGEPSFSNVLLTPVTVYLSRDSDTGEYSEVGKNDNGEEHIFVIPTMVDGEVHSVDDAVKIARKHGWDKYGNFKFPSQEEAEKWIQENGNNVLTPEPDNDGNTVENRIKGIINKGSKATTAYFKENGNSGESERAAGIRQEILIAISTAKTQDDLGQIQLIIDALKEQKSGWGYLGSQHESLYDELNTELDSREEKVGSQGAPRSEQEWYADAWRTLDNLDTEGKEWTEWLQIPENRTEFVKKLATVTDNRTGELKYTPDKIGYFMHRKDGLEGFLNSLTSNTSKSLTDVQKLNLMKYIRGKLSKGYKADSFTPLLKKFFLQNPDLGYSDQDAEILAKKYQGAVDEEAARLVLIDTNRRLFTTGQTPEGAAAVADLKHKIISILDLPLENEIKSGKQSNAGTTSEADAISGFFIDRLVSLVWAKKAEEKIDKLYNSGEPVLQDKIDEAYKEAEADLDKVLKEIRKDESITDDQGFIHYYQTWDLGGIKKAMPDLNKVRLSDFKNHNKSILKLIKSDAETEGSTFDKGLYDPHTKTEATPTAIEFPTSVVDGTSLEQQSALLLPAGIYHGGHSLTRRNTYTEAFEHLMDAAGKGLLNLYDSKELTTAGAKLHNTLDDLVNLGGKETKRLRGVYGNQNIVVMPLVSPQGGSVGKTYYKAYLRKGENLHPIPVRTESIGDRNEKSEKLLSHYGTLSGGEKPYEQEKVKALIDAAELMPPDKKATEIYLLSRRLSSYVRKSLIEGRITQDSIQEGSAKWGDGEPITEEDLNPKTQLLIPSDTITLENDIRAIRNSRAQDYESVLKDVKENELLESYIVWKNALPKNSKEMGLPEFLMLQFKGPLQIGHEEANNLMAILGKE